MSLLFLAPAALFLSISATALFHSRWARRLPALTSLSATAQCFNPAGGPVRCSIVVPARDEDGRIEETVRRLLAQRDALVEVIVIDDRSTDRTGDILRRLTQEDERVRMLRVEELPAGWLGKCHACHLGADAATGEWILFTDADCWLKPDVITRALRVAEGDGVDHITLTPGIKTESASAQAWHLLFLISLSNWLSGVNRDRPKAYVGLGAFNLVRATAYQRSGGYMALRLTVVDDVRLGLLLRRAGSRTRGFIGGDDVECHWGTTVNGMIKIMEKNYFAVLDFRLAVAITAGLGGMLCWSAAILGPATGSVTGIAAALALLSLSLPAYVFARRLKWGVPCALLAPFIFPFIFYAVLNSAWVTVRQGGVRWRETFYSLDELRQGAVR